MTRLKTSPAVWIWITVLAVLTLAGSGLLFFRLLLPRLLFSGVYPEGAYVSGRPDLTFNAELADIQSVDQKLQGFFEARGLTLADTRNLRIAAGLHYRPQPEMAPTHCYIFVCPRTGGIYVAAEGIGT